MDEPGSQALEEVRANIDALDRQIVKLIAARQQCVVRAVGMKRTVDAVRAPARVEQVIEQVRSLAVAAGASPTVVEETYRALIAAFIDLELSTHEDR